MGFWMDFGVGEELLGGWWREIPGGNFASREDGMGG